MRVKRALGLVLALIALSMAPAATLAQDAGTQTDAAAAPTTEASVTPPPPWVKFCGDLADGRKLCLMRPADLRQGQARRPFHPSGKPRGFEPASGHGLDAERRHAALWAEAADRQWPRPHPALHRLRLADVHTLRTVVNEAFINSLKRGGVLKLKAKNARGKDVTIEIDLAGFTAVYNGDDYIPLDQQQSQPQDASGALDQAVQDLAEQMRRQQDGEGQ